MYQGTEYYLPRLGVGNGVGGGGITSEDDISLYVTIELLHNYRSILTNIFPFIAVLNVEKALGSRLGNFIPVSLTMIFRLTDTIFNVEKHTLSYGY